jgi:hypothetical protein
MSSINLLTNTYAGKRYGQYVTPALLPKKGLYDRGIVSLAEGAKNQLKMLSVNKQLEFQNPNAIFTASSGDIDRGEKTLSLVKYEVMDQLDFSAVLATWESEELKKGSKNDRVAPTALYDFIVENIYTKKLGIMNEMLYILGKAGVTGVGSATFSAAYPGLLPRIEADATVRKFSLPDNAQMALTGVTTANPGVVTVASTTGISVGDTITFINLNGNQQIGGVTINGQSARVVAKTATTLTLDKQVTGVTPATSGSIFFINALNVMDVLTYAYGLVEDRIRLLPGTKMLFGTDVEKAYRVANAKVANGAGLYFRDQYFEFDDKIKFLDMECEAMPYWKPNTIAVWNPDNVWLGTDLLGDEVELQIVWMGDVTLDQVYRLRNSMKSDINYIYGDEILYIRPA